jgi:transposase-like protein
LAELPAALQTFDKTFHRCLLYKPESAAYGCAASRNRMASILSEDHFHNEDAAYDYVEARLWRDGPVCPHCGVTKGNVGKLQGRSTRIRLYKCYVCGGQFTVKVGTMFQSSHLPLRMWLQAIHLLCSNKKDVSTRQLQLMLRVAPKTAWHLGLRIREAIRDDGFGAAGKVEEFHQSQVWCHGKADSEGIRNCQSGFLSRRRSALFISNKGMIFRTKRSH